MFDARLNHELGRLATSAFFSRKRLRAGRVLGLKDSSIAAMIPERVARVNQCQPLIRVGHLVLAFHPALLADGFDFVSVLHDVFQ